MTTYEEIFNRFSREITDYDLADLNPENKIEVLTDVLDNACDSWYPLPSGVSLDRDGVKFLNKLSKTVFMVIVYRMISEWTSPYLYNQDLFESNFSTKEYTSYSDANKINAIRLLADSAKKQANVLSTKISVKNVMGGLK